MSSVTDGNLYPNDGAFYATVPEDQVKAEHEEAIEVLTALPALLEVIKHLDDRIAATDSVKQAFVIAENYNIDSATALVVMDIVRQQLETERRAIKGLIDGHM